MNGGDQAQYVAKLDNIGASLAAVAAGAGESRVDFSE